MIRLGKRYAKPGSTIRAAQYNESKSCFRQRSRRELIVRVEQTARIFLFRRLRSLIVFERQLRNRRYVTASALRAIAFHTGSVNESGNRCRVYHARAREWGPDDLVGVALSRPRNDHWLIGHLNPRRLMPIDPTYPKDRFLTCRDSGAKFVLTDRRTLLSRGPTRQDDSDGLRLARYR